MTTAPTIKKPDTRPPEPTSARIAELPPGRFYWESIGPIWEVVDIYRGPDSFLKSFASVTRAQGLLLAAHWCQSEVKNGGLHQFFSNATGVLGPEAVRGFSLVELSAAAGIVGEAIAKFGKWYPRNREERQHLLAKLEASGKSREDWDPFCDLDQAFYALPGIKSFGDHVDGFVQRNMAMFFR